LTSNTASAAVVVPIVIPVAVAAGINPFVPALAATFAASFGFMLPVWTPQNAVVYGSGAVPSSFDTAPNWGRSPGLRCTALPA
jgi:sodium-dependent dicarboxylate transporter 2/3/5